MDALTRDLKFLRSKSGFLIGSSVKFYAILLVIAMAVLDSF